MKKSTVSFIAVVLIIILVSLSCNLPISNKDQAEEGAVVSLEKVNKNLGDVYQSMEGGYAFQVIPDFELEETWGISYMYPEDADPDAGPMFILIGGGE